MKRMLLCCLFISVVLLSACTKHERAKYFGGTIKVDLPTGQKLEIATWKDADLWYLVRPMRSEEKPERYEFIESSAFGVMEGKVIFQEH